MLKLRSEIMELKQEIKRISKIVDHVKGKEVAETPLSEKAIPKIHLWWSSLDLEIIGVGILVDVSHIMMNSFWDRNWFSLVRKVKIFKYWLVMVLVVLVQLYGWAYHARFSLISWLMRNHALSGTFSLMEALMRKSAEVSFGAHPEIWVSIFQSSNLSESSTSMLQATYNDTFGSVIICPSSCSIISGPNLQTLPVGFIISGPGDVASTSSSSEIVGGSILTMFSQSSMESDTPITTIVTSTMQKINAVIKC